MALVCYGPALTSSYGFSDDYPFLKAAVRGELELGTTVAGGRPIYGLLIRYGFAPLGDIGDLRYVRLAGILGVVMLAFAFHRTLVSYGWGATPSALLATIILTLPSSQVYASWAIAALQVFAALSAYWAFRFAEGTGPARAVAAVGCMVVAITIHQSAAMCFWVFGAVALFAPETPPARQWRRFGRYGAIVLAALAIGFVVYRVGGALVESSLGPGRSSLTSDPWGKARWFVQEPLVNALNVVNLFPQRWLAAVMAAFIVVGLLSYFRGPASHRVAQLSMALALLPISYLPNLVVAESWATYRTQPALTGLVVIYVFLAAWGVRRVWPAALSTTWLTAGLGAAALVSASAAAYNVRVHVIAVQLRELAMMRAQLAQPDLARARRIYVIGLDGDESWRVIAPGARYDEFGLPSSAKPWAPTAAVYLLLREIDPSRAELPIRLAPAGAPAPPPGALVVDMRRLLDARPE